MRTVLLANNELGAAIGSYLHERGELVGVVLHPIAHRRATSALEDLDVPRWVWPDGEEDVRALAPECLLSVLFNYRIPDGWLGAATWRPLNLHPGLLPWNRGNAPNAWPLFDGTPAGVTLHVMAPAIDTGALVAQRQVEVSPADTAETLYRRLVAAGLELFRETWPVVRDIEPTVQVGEGTSHRMADLAALDLGPADFLTLDRLRARTFPPYGAEFVRDGRRYRATVTIVPVEEG